MIQGAVDAAPTVHLPQIIAQMVYEGIINSSVLFEECVVSAARFFQNYMHLTQKSSILTDRTALSIKINILAPAGRYVSSLSSRLHLVIVVTKVDRVEGSGFAYARLE